MKIELPDGLAAFVEGELTKQANLYGSSTDDTRTVNDWASILVYEVGQAVFTRRKDWFQLCLAKTIAVAISAYKASNRSTSVLNDNWH